MDAKEFAMWKAFTESSHLHWIEDEIYRLNGRGAFYFLGGEDGIYFRIQKDGILEFGDYEGAVPHIGAAIFKPIAEKQYANYSAAFTAAMELAGKEFLLDMLNGSQQDAIWAANQAYEQTGARMSVLKQIREAQKPSRKGKAPSKKKDDIEI